MHKTRNFERQILEGYNLTTAEIIYHMPDMPHILQSYVWQDYDLSPKFPVLNEFLHFWTKEIEGPIHSIVLAEKLIIQASELHYHAGDYLVH